MPWLTTFVTSDLSGESIGFATTTTHKSHGNSLLIVGAVTILLRRGRVRFSPMLGSILFVLHWACTPMIGRPVLGVFILNRAYVHQKWKLTNTLVIHNLLHLKAILHSHPFSEPHECYSLALFMCPPLSSLELCFVIA